MLNRPTKNNRKEKRACKDRHEGSWPSSPSGSCAPLFVVIPVGVIPASGTLDVMIGAPSVGPGFDGLNAQLQPLLVGGAGDLRSGDAALMVVLDDAF